MKKEKIMGPEEQTAAMSQKKYMERKHPAITKKSDFPMSYCWHCRKTTDTTEENTCLYCGYDKRGRVP